MRRRRVLAALCLTQTSSWGISYYAFPVSSVSIIRDTGWSAPVITAALSVDQLATALIGIPVGRILDRIAPRLVMTAGSVVAVVALPVVAVAPNLRCFTAARVAGPLTGAVLYPPAFAASTH
ncbi:MFS transporter [Nocardia sp. NPDC023852]|uniref:MFS transporter n=1 Tax=Nocardia sp. NPDC023852 TaxID=3154697 RepID=UPI0033C8F8BB